MTVVGIVHSAGADALACRIPAWTLTDLVPAATRTASAQTTLVQHSIAQRRRCTALTTAIHSVQQHAHNHILNCKYIKQIPPAN